jgi:hypothetical protein
LARRPRKLWAHSPRKATCPLKVVTGKRNLLILDFADAQDSSKIKRVQRALHGQERRLQPSSALDFAIANARTAWSFKPRSVFGDFEGHRNPRALPSIPATQPGPADCCKCARRQSGSRTTQWLDNADSLSAIRCARRFLKFRSSRCAIGRKRDGPF